MTDPHTTPQTPETATETTGRDDDLVAEQLVEEISIDGMCGVY